MADEPAVDVEAIQRALAEKEQLLANANSRLTAMEETVNALRPRPVEQPLPPGKRFAIPQHLRAQIAANGVTDAEIDQNGDLIVPFISAYLGAAATEVMAIIQQQSDEITQLNMLRDLDTYPHADAMYKEMTKIRQSELKQGRYINPETAYRLAVANNIDKLGGGTSGEGQFDSPRAAPATPVAARSRDASAGNIFRTVRAPVTAPEKPASSADDLMSMSREDRRAFFESHGNTPIR